MERAPSSPSSPEFPPFSPVFNPGDRIFALEEENHSLKQRLHALLSKVEEQHRRIQFLEVEKQQPKDEYCALSTELFYMSKELVFLERQFRNTIINFNALKNRHATLEDRARHLNSAVGVFLNELRTATSPNFCEEHSLLRLQDAYKKV